VERKEKKRREVADDELNQTLHGTMVSRRFSAVTALVQI